MQLYGSLTSPYARHCRIAILETQIPCEFLKTTADTPKSPTDRIPFLHHGDVTLTDSSAIIRYIREQAGAAFLPDISEYDRFLLINTAMDTALNIFLLERDGVTPENSRYLARQEQRIKSCLKSLNNLPLPAASPYSDMHLRLACFMEWCLFRKRMSFEAYPTLTTFLADIQHYPPFADTAPHD